MIMSIIDPGLAQEIRDLITRRAALRWKADYGEPFSAHWLPTSLNLVGDLVDVTFSWKEKQ